MKTLLRLMNCGLKYFNDILDITKDVYLLELDRWANKKTNKKPVFWGGLIINNTLCGNNQMGKYLMQLQNTI